MRSLGFKLDVFQIDDGFETKVGDWFTVDKDKFPHGLEPIAEKINGEGFTAGLWLAPFVCEKTSELYSSHPDWLLKGADGNPVYTGCNWSGMYALDFYNPDVRVYVKNCILPSPPGKDERTAPHLAFTLPTAKKFTAFARMRYGDKISGGKGDRRTAVDEA